MTPTIPPLPVKDYADENNNNGENSIKKQQPTINRHHHRRGPLVPLHISANEDTKDNDNSIIDNSNDDENVAMRNECVVKEKYNDTYGKQQGREKYKSQQHDLKEQRREKLRALRERRLLSKSSIPSSLLSSTINLSSKSRTTNISSKIRTSKTGISSSPLLKSILSSPLEYERKDSSIETKYQHQDVSLKGEKKESSYKMDIPPLHFNRRDYHRKRQQEGEGDGEEEEESPSSSSSSSSSSSQQQEQERLRQKQERLRKEKQKEKQEQHEKQKLQQQQQQKKTLPTTPSSPASPLLPSFSTTTTSSAVTTVETDRIIKPSFKPITMIAPINEREQCNRESASVDENNNNRRDKYYIIPKLGRVTMKANGKNSLLSSSSSSSSSLKSPLDENIIINKSPPTDISSQIRNKNKVEDIDETKKEECISSDSYNNKRKRITTTNLVLPKMTAIRDRKNVKTAFANTSSSLSSSSSTTTSTTTSRKRLLFGGGAMRSTDNSMVEDIVNPIDVNDDESSSMNDSKTIISHGIKEVTTNTNKQTVAFNNTSTTDENTGMKLTKADIGYMLNWNPLNHRVSSSTKEDDNGSSGDASTIGKVQAMEIIEEEEEESSTTNQHSNSGTTKNMSTSSSSSSSSFSRKVNGNDNEKLVPVTVATSIPVIATTTTTSSNDTSKSEREDNLNKINIKRNQSTKRSVNRGNRKIESSGTSSNSVSPHSNIEVDHHTHNSGGSGGDSSKKEVSSLQRTPHPHPPAATRRQRDDGKNNNSSRCYYNTGSKSSPEDDNNSTNNDSSSPSSQSHDAFRQLVRKSNVISVNDSPYLKLGAIGKGGSCKVYRALSTEGRILAIKKVKLQGMSRKNIESYANEISLLKRLRSSPCIIQMYDSEVDITRKVILLVMEMGEVDLNHVLQQQVKQNSCATNGTGGVGKSFSSSLSMDFIRLTWRQMLSAVDCIHNHRIIHGDLKPANFLFVKGALKLIDFGIAKAIQGDETNNIYRESQIGTLNYMSPESILDTNAGNGRMKMKCGKPSDVWSLGCILYQMCYGRTPFAELQMFSKLQAITDVAHRIKYPDIVDPLAIDCMKLCLCRKPEERALIVGNDGLLNKHPLLNPLHRNL